MSSTRSKRATSVIIASAAIVLMAGMAGCNKLQSAQKLVSEAREYQQKGDNKAAVIQLKNALQKNPDDADARYLLGSIYLETGDPLSAEKEIRKAISLGMPPANALPSLAKALLMQGQFQKVLDETDKDPRAKSDATLLTLRGDAYLVMGKGAESKESFELALKDKPDLPEALIGLAKQALSDKDVDGATKYSEQAVAKNPKSVDARQFKGDLLRVQGKTDAALAAYDEVLKLQPGSATAHIAKANLEISMKKYAEAKVDIDAAKKSTPNSLVVMYTRALLDFSQGNYATALDSLQQVLRVAPEHMPSVLLAGAVQYSLGSLQQAEQYLKQYLEKNPSNLYARKLLASTLLKNGQPQRVIEILDPVLNAEQKDPQLLVLAGQSYMQTKEFSKATEYFEKANAIAPDTASVHTALGMSMLGQGENDSAVAELEKASSLDTKSPKAGILLVMTHLRLKEYDKALTAVQTLEKEQPDNPLVQNLKGGVYLGKKDTANARASFEKALAIQPTYFPAVANLAQLDILDKKPEAAKKRFEAFLAKDKKNMQAMTALAGLAQSMGNSEEAKNWLERANKENPDAVQPSRLLITQYLKTGDKQKALALATKLQSATPNNPELLEMLAQTQFANGDKPAALESYARLAALLPDSAPVQLRIASVYAAMQNDTAATDALKKALRLDPNYMDAKLAMAGIDLRNGHNEEALSIARQVQKQQAKSPIGYVMEGDVLMSQKNPALAAKAYEQAFALGNSGPLLVKLHAALTQAGKGKNADARLSQWLKDHANDTSTRIYFAELNLMNQRNKAAIEQFQIVLKTDPQNAAVLNNLAWASDQEKDPHALDYAEKAYQLAPDNPAVMDTIGWMLVDHGNTSRGLPILQKAVSLAPDAPDIRYHLVQALVKSGDKVKARKELEQLLAAGKPFSKIDEAKALQKQL